MSYQIAKLIARIAENLPQMDESVIQGWIENPRALKQILREGLTPSPKNLQGVVVLNWSSVYEHLGLREQYELFVQALAMPTDSNRWLIPVLQGVTCNQVVEVLKQLGVNFYLYADDLDQAVARNIRDAKNGSYAVTCQAVVEADEANKNLSAKDCQQQGIVGMTLLERLLLELAYYLATQKHLDIKNVTLCTGSRYADGRVPYVRWDSGSREVRVNWDSTSGRDGGLRTRSVVSVPVKSCVA